MIHQQNPKLLPQIHSSGCNLLSHLFIAQIENRKVLSVEEINNLYSVFIKKKWIDKQCTVNKPNEIINYVCFKKILQVGSIIKGKTTYWHPDHHYDWIICKYTTNGIYGTHFVVSDEFGHPIYDPLLGQGYTKTGIEAFRLYQVVA